MNGEEGGDRTMDFEMVMKELEALGTERIKKTYINNGAHDPLFGVATGKMKPIAKKIKKNQALAGAPLRFWQLRCYVFCWYHCRPNRDDCGGF